MLDLILMSLCASALIMSLLSEARRKICDALDFQFLSIIFLLILIKLI